MKKFVLAVLMIALATSAFAQDAPTTLIYSGSYNITTLTVTPLYVTLVSVSKKNKIQVFSANCMTAGTTTAAIGLRVGTTTIGKVGPGLTANTQYKLVEPDGCAYEHPAQASTTTINAYAPASALALTPIYINIKYRLIPDYISR